MVFFFFIVLFHFLNFVLFLLSSSDSHLLRCSSFAFSIRLKKEHLNFGFGVLGFSHNECKRRCDSSGRSATVSNFNYEQKNENAQNRMNWSAFFVCDVRGVWLRVRVFCFYCRSIIVETNNLLYSRWCCFAFSLHAFAFLASSLSANFSDSWVSSERGKKW